MMHSPGQLFDAGAGARADSSADSMANSTADSSAEGSAGADAGAKLEQAAERLSQKADEAAAGTTAPDPAATPGQDDQPAGTGQQSRLDELRDSSRNAQSERNSGRERDEYLRDDDLGPGADRPW
ncbi:MULTISPECIES: hypothetical protein [unclassified Arthrobacter]|uniref:hypothetical protein n=1 Tax=unclassified Arthrobacter TaxID=235627 RepID=UPI003398A652